MDLTRTMRKTGVQKETEGQTYQNSLFIRAFNSYNPSGLGKRLAAGSSKVTLFTLAGLKAGAILADLGVPHQKFPKIALTKRPQAARGLNMIV